MYIKVNHVIIHPIPGLCSPSFCANYRQHCLVETPKSWWDAQSYCRERGFDLATIDDMGAMEALLPLIDNNDAVWIGLHGTTTDKWFWSLADNDFYKEGERDYRHFQNEGQDFMVYLQNGQWFTGHKSNNYYVMCYDANKQGRDRYVLVPQAMSPLAAREYCRDYHTDMVAIRNETENQIINEISAGHRVWIGLFKDMWIWSDMRYSSLRFWKGQDYFYNPSTTYCTASNGKMAGRWSPMLCTEKHPALCACNRARVLKVKVRSEDLQDLNDPATKAAILKLTQTLVDEATLTNGHKLTWITHPGGQVFTKEQCQEEDKVIGDG
ncbi:hypothetical protein N1851_009538 [Merluccius polli]|uniref:C-type lectin domain-containing protein n=1 Tax=Merluccius polli TaxID=89951 RepID=A0AA47P6W4_MERPO|nr:hypothetical protein N1851_009538 [Merluccius polli]